MALVSPDSGPIYQMTVNFFFGQGFCFSQHEGPQRYGYRSEASHTQPCECLLRNLDSSREKIGDANLLAKKLYKRVDNFYKERG